MDLNGILKIIKVTHMKARKEKGLGELEPRSSMEEPHAAKCQTSEGEVLPACAEISEGWQEVGSGLF